MVRLAMIAWLAMALAPAPRASAQDGEKPATGEKTSGDRAGHPYQPTADAVIEALGDRSPLAFIRPEAIGTDRDPADLERWMLQALGRERKPALIGPDEVLRRAGVEFTISPAGVASVAVKCEARAALFLRMIQSSEGVEIYSLLVDSEGAVLLDRAFELPGLPELAEQPAGRPGPRAPAPASGLLDELVPMPPPDAADQPADETPALQPRQAYERRRLALSPSGRQNGDWRVLREGNPVGELDLAQMSGRLDLVERIERRIASLQFKRNLGIGLTLGGFAAAALSTPFFKSSNDSGLTAGGVICGVGLAAGTAGAVIWHLFGDEAVRAGGPDPVHHLLGRDEAEQLVRKYNDMLQRELDLHEEPAGDPSGKKKVTVHWHLAPVPAGGAVGGLVVVF